MKFKSALFLSTILLSCGSATPTATSVSVSTETQVQKKMLKSVSPSYKENFTQGATVKFGYKTDGDVDSVRITVDGQAISGEQMIAPLDRVGRVAYRITAFKGAENQSMDGEFLVVAPNAPKVQKVVIKNRYPHQKDAYTQGLLFHNGKLYESTGEYGRSSLRIADLATGNVVKSRNLDDKYFAEGLVLLQDKLYQLTWREGVVFVYDVQTLEPVREYAIAGQGWGIATDGEFLYVSDGSHRITKYDPDGFRKISQIEVVDNRQRVTEINELEWIDGKIWANIYTYDTIAVIDPASGVVERYIDCEQLKAKIGNADSADVLNGIAHDPKTGRIWLTGKNWDTLFEVSVK